MKPKNSSYRKDTCAEVSSNCVIWEGPDLSCVQLCQGDSVSDTISKLAIDYCTFKDSLDLAEFDLGCLFVPCTACPEPDKTFVNVMALVRDKVCELEERIDDINPTTTIEAAPFNVNLKCLAITDGSGNILNDDSQDEQVQAIIDKVCSLSDAVELLTSEVDDHEDRITTLENAVDTSVPSVQSDCVFIGSKPVDQAYELLDTDYCELKGAVGTPGDIGTAIGQQPELPELVGDPAYIVGVTNMAESLNNAWLEIANLRSRIILIEQNCCAPNCDNVKIGFSTTFNADESVTLNFNAGTGTSIPNGWTDCGSILTVTDTIGNSIAVSLTIVNNYTSPDIDLTSFTRGSTLTFTLDVKMCSEALNCQKCVTKTVVYAGAECCTYTNVSTGEITIIYTTTAIS